MTALSIYLFCHVAGAVVWVGAGCLMAILGARSSLSDERERHLSYARDSEWLGLRLFLPASLLTLIFGILLVHEGPWGYDRLWIQLGVAVLALSTLLGMAVFGPGWARVTKLAAAKGIDSAEVQARIGRLQLFGWLDVGLLLAAVWVMAIKPTRDEPVALVIAAAIPVGATMVGLALRRGAARPATVRPSP